MSGVLRAELRRITTTKLWWSRADLHLRAQCRHTRRCRPLWRMAARQGGRCASSPFTDPGIIRSIYNGGNVLSSDPRHGGRHRGHRQRISVRHACRELSGHRRDRVRMLLWQGRRVVDLRRDLRDRQRGRRHAWWRFRSCWRTVGRSLLDQPGDLALDHSWRAARSRCGP